MRKILLLMTIMFVTGWFFSSVYSQFTEINDSISNTQYQDTDNFPGISEEKPEDSISDSIIILFDEPENKPSPADHIKENQIHVYNDKVVIDIKNPEWAKFTPTYSMDPVIDEFAHAIEKVPESPAEIEVGDIVSYRSEYADGIIIHRVVEIAVDSEGWYCKLKGDNNKAEDPGKVRFEQIERYVVAIIY